MRIAAVAAAITMGLIPAGCGGEPSPPEIQPIALRPPSLPSTADCGLTGDGSAADADQPPKPGTYLYRTTGQRAFLGEQKRVTKLPSTTKMIVTPSRRKGAQSCFTVQRAYEPELGDTGTFVINGSDTYLRSGRFQAGADVTAFTPRPSILVVSGSELDWNGAFRGRTTGRYRTSVVGRKRIRVNGISVPSVGISTRVEYAGDIEGFERSTRWFSLRHGVVVQESETLERAFGLDRLRLSYKSRLVSLDPS